MQQLLAVFSSAYGLSLVPQGCSKIHQILNRLSK